VVIELFLCTRRARALQIRYRPGMAEQHGHLRETFSTERPGGVAELPGRLEVHKSLADRNTCGRRPADAPLDLTG
jgi:hypothetical protein